MSIVGFFAGWTLVALLLAASGLAWSIRRDDWREAEAVKFLVFRTLSADVAHPSFAPRITLMAGLAAGTALFACGFLIGVSVFVALLS